MAPTDLLLVEGPDDEQLFVHLFKHYRLPLSGERLNEPGKVSIERAGGFERLRQSLPIRLSIIETRHIGIIVDADVAPQNRWDSLRAVLSDAGYTELPKTLAPEGTLITQEMMPTVGVWVMPDNIQPGALENFARSLIRAEDALWGRAEACVDAIPDAERRWQPPHLMKAKMHTWLAWQEEPGAPIGLALTRRYLDADAPQVTPVVAWLRRTFEL